MRRVRRRRHRTLQASADGAADAGGSGRRDALSLADRYVELALALDEHVDGLVFSYVAERPSSSARSDLAEEADRLLAAVGEVEPESRRRWFEAQLWALATVAHGQELSLRDDAERCFGLEPRRIEEEELVAAQRVLDEALPGSGDPRQRYVRWLASTELPGEHVAPVLAAVAQSLRERTRKLVGLPDGEEIELELAADQGWVAFSRYLGNLRSRFSYNTDLPLAAVDVPHLAAHEAYPGHHTEDAWKDAVLVRKQGLREFTLSLAVGVQPVIAEGIAEVAAELVADEVAHEVVAEEARRVGVQYDAAVGLRVAQARRVLSGVSANLAILHDAGADHDELLEYARRWSLQPEQRVKKSVDSLERRPFRASVFCYTEGLRLCRSFVGGDVGRFKRLLTEQLTPADLTSSPAA